MKQHFMKIAAAATLAAGLAFAQAPATPNQGAATPNNALQGRHRFGPALRQRIMRNLNLTEDQKAQAKSIFQQAKTTAQPIREQLKQDRQALATAVKNDDTAQIQNLSATEGSLQGQVLAIRSGAMAKFYAILTPDQKAKVDQMQQRMKKMRQRASQRNNG